MANNKEIAHQILTAVGGASNLKDATHCMTRLRLYLKDDSIPKDEEVKAIGGVLGVVRGGQQYQVIIGTNVPKVYEELCKLANLTANAPVEDAKAAAEDAAVAKPKLTPKQVGKNIMGYMAGCMTPLIPVLLAGALFRCINSLCGPELLGLYPAESDLYILFDFLYDAAFYFMPILAGFNAAKQLGITPMLGGFIGCILMVPDFAAYATSGEPFTVFGIPCTVTNYAQTVLPIMLSVFFFSVVYKLIKKIMPDVLTTVFTPFLSMLIEVLKAVREAVGPRFPIEFRMSGSELFEGGYDLEEGCRIAQQIEPYIDLLHVSAGTYQRGFGDTHPSMFKEHGCNVYLAAEIKKHVKVPVATIGGLNDPAQMEEIIASGKADIVYMARALLADPFLPNKVMANRGDEIVRCLRCFTCMAERAATSTRRCTVNPLIGRELEGDTIYPAPEKKKVLVAGGGPGGLYAAYTAARRGHQVILCEKDAELGGILKSEQALPFKQEMYQLAGTYANLARKAGVEIRLNTAVTPELVAAEAPDALIIAVGSAPLVPPIPGLKGDNVVVVNNYYKEKDKVTDDVVVFGGGLAGCECAIHLGQEGKRVHLVEMRDVLAPDANVRHRPLLLKEIEKYVTVHTGCKGLEVRPDGILCETKDGEQVLVPGTSVICALGQRSRTADVEALRGTAPFVRIIGDAAKVSTITNAVYWGYHAALDIGAGMD